MSILWERHYIVHFPLPLCTKDTEQEIPGDALQSWRILHWTNWLKSSKTRLRAKLQWMKLNKLIIDTVTIPLPGSIIESCIKVLVPFQFVDKILKCDHPNESYWAAVSCGSVRDANLRRPKIGRLSFFRYPPGISTTSPPPPKNWPSPQWEWLRTLYDILHDLHTIKIWNHRFDARNNLCQWLNRCKYAPETVLRMRKIQVLS